MISYFPNENLFSFIFVCVFIFYTVIYKQPDHPMEPKRRLGQMSKSPPR